MQASPLECPTGLSTETERAEENREFRFFGFNASGCEPGTNQINHYMLLLIYTDYLIHSRSTSVY
jgi:hypothetical protein